MIPQNKNISQGRIKAIPNVIPNDALKAQKVECINTDSKGKMKLQRNLKIASKINGSLNNTDEDENENEEEIKDHMISSEEFDVLRAITNNFQKNWRQIKNSSLFKNSILKDFEKEEIRYHIKMQRKKNKRQKRGKNFILDRNNQHKLLTKRPRPNYELIESDTDDQEIPLIPLNSYKILQPPAYRDLALDLVNNFIKQNEDVKNKILDQIATLILTDEQVLHSSIEHQTTQIYNDCLKLFQESNYNEALLLLNQTSPMSAIIIQLKISKVLPTLVDECVTLSKTFLPQLSKCIHFNFIDQEYHKTCQRVVQSLVQYTLDTNFKLELGLVLFALQYAPEILQLAMKIPASHISLAKGFERLGFVKDIAVLMSLHSEIFLWNDVIAYLKSQACNNYETIARVLSKMIVKQNPKEKLLILAKYFDQRPIFITSLLEQKAIPYTVSQMIEILEMLKTMNTDTIQKLFKESPNDWMKQATVYSGKDIIKDDEMQKDAVESFYKERIKGVQKKDRILLETMVQISKEVESLCETYQHSLYQCAVAALIISSPGSFKLTDMPTGSGKTWVQALIAKHYLKQQIPVTIVEPNENLTQQTLNLLNNLDLDLSVLSIDQFYDYNNQDIVVIVNEHDTIIKDNSFKVTAVGLSGLWSLENRTIFFFSATSGVDYARIIKATLKSPTVLSFQSEYELVHKCSSINQGDIKPCKNLDEVMMQIEKDIAQYYEVKPIIIFIDKVNTQQIEQLLQKNQYQQYLNAATEENLKTIRGWKYGILILNPKDAVGVNTKFAVDSIVLITHEVTSDGDYKQLQGRSSRTRGLCQSIYYPITNNSVQQIQSKMKSGNIQQLQELSKVIKAIWSRRNNNQMQEAVKAAQEGNDKIKTLKHLEQYLGSTEYGKLLKEVKL